MSLQVPPYLNGRSPEYLYNVMQSTYQRSSEYRGGEYTMGCSDRPYGMTVCHGPEREGIRYGSFHSSGWACLWFGVKCSSGNFYSRTFTVGQSSYELRAGVFTMGHHQGGYAVAVVDARDTQFLTQSLDVWGNVMGDTLLLGAALANACDPVVEPFTHRSYHAPANAASSSRAQVVLSTTIIESGTNTYCKNPIAPQYNPSPLIIPQLANWWSEFQDSMVALMHPINRFTPMGEMASIE